MPESRGRRIGRAQLGAAAALAVVALAGGLYVVRDGNAGDPAGAAACAAARPAAQALDPLIGGEVAAFLPAKDPAPLTDLGFTGPDGAPVTLAAFQGRTVLLNIWATWCVPCRTEMPALDRLQAALGGAGFTVQPVSIDTGDSGRPRAFLASIGVTNLPLNTDPSTEIFLALKGRGLALGLPVTLLVDRNGCHLGHMNGPAEWDSDEGKALIGAAMKGEAG